MAGLNPNLILARSIEELFRDKTTGLPLVGGKVFFFRDIARGTPKPVFTIGGTPPNYTYTELPNPVILNASGKFSSDGTDSIVPYYFPFLGTDIDDNGTIDLYYVEVYDADGSLQETREGWPNDISNADQSTDNLINYVPNPQFLLHNLIPPVSQNNFKINQVFEAETNIAPGGWFFVQNNPSSATRLISFNEIQSTSTQPSADPRYQLVYQATVGGSDTLKDLEIRFPNVFTFTATSISGEGIYNLFFEASSENSSVDVQIVKFYFFGSGGSISDPPEVIVTKTINVSNTVVNVSLSFLDTDITGKSVGGQGDDYVSIGVRFPNQTCTVFLTNFCITKGSQQLPSFPPQDASEQLSPSTSGSITYPSPDNLDNKNLYLPILNGPNGFEYDTSSIGQVIYASRSTPAINELPFDGSTYVTDRYNETSLIPYSRLQAVLFNSTLFMPQWGTGAKALTGIYPTSNTVTDKFRIVNNQPGNAGAPVAAIGLAGFNFVEVHKGVTGNVMYSYIAEVTSPGTPTNIFFIENFFQTAAADNQITDGGGGGATGFTLSIERRSTTGGGSVGDLFSGIPVIYRVATVSASGLASKFFTFLMDDASTSTEGYYVWYTVDGVGTDPAPGVPFTNAIQVNLLSTDNAIDVATKTSSAINGWQIYEIKTTDASLINDGDAFTMNGLESNGTTNVPYFVWYDKSGSAIEPLLSGIGIKVTISASLTAAQVADETWKTINRATFSIPNAKGQFIRIWDDTNSKDPDFDIRYFLTPGLYGNLLGSFQESANISHRHSIPNTIDVGVTGASGTGALGSDEFSGFGGSFESRPINMALYAYIKY